MPFSEAKNFLYSGIELGQEINVGHGKFGKKRIAVVGQEMFYKLCANLCVQTVLAVGPRKNSRN